MPIPVPRRGLGHRHTSSFSSTPFLPNLSSAGTSNARSTSTLTASTSSFSSSRGAYAWTQPGRRRNRRRRRVKGSCDTLAILQVESHGGGGNDNNNYRNNFKSNDDDDNAGGENFGGGSGGFFKTTWLSFFLSFLLFAGTAAAAAAAASVDADNEDDESYLLLEGWLSWLDKLVNECLDDQGNLDLSRLEKMLETSKGSKSKNAEGKRLADLADELWEAVDQGNIKRAESVIESVDKDGALEFGKHAIRSICGKDQKMIEAAVEK